MRWLALLAPLAAPALAAEPARVEMTADGPVLVKPNGMTLYVNSAEDLGGEKFSWKCTNKPPVQLTDAQAGLGPRKMIGAEHQVSCAEKFPPYLAAAGASPTGDFTLTARPEGAMQWVYRGFPLYTSKRDVKPGDRGGINVGRLFGAEGRIGQFRLALAAWPLPASLKFIRRDAGLMLAAAGDDRPLYTPRGKLKPGARGDFQPVPAPELVEVNGDWSVIDEGDGQRQFAFRGQPLYMPPPGIAEFEIAATGKWDPVIAVKDRGRPAGIGKHLSLLGDVYTTGDGRTLYTYNCSAGGVLVIGDRYIECDAPGDPAGYMVASCGGPGLCADRWRPYAAAAGAKPKGDWSIVEVTYPMFIDPRGTLYPADAPKVRAWAYRGRPLFTFHMDRAPGDIWGDATQGLWGSGFFALRTPDPGFE